MTPAAEEVLKALRRGKIALEGQFFYSSNATFLVTCEQRGSKFQAVYKPQAGQSPLWDFEARGLPKREVAAYTLCQYAGWDFVPPTIFRGSGLPAGPGSLQLFIPHDPLEHYFTFAQEVRDQARPIALFDLVCNNADRKAGHLLRDENGKIWAIDHALCFHAQPKLRTVLWDFAGEGFSPQEDEMLGRLWEGLGPEQELARWMVRWISVAEIEALAERVRDIRHAGCFPTAEPGRRSFPWPPV